MNDFNTIHALYHSEIARRALEDRKQNLQVINTDFMVDLPDPIRNAVDHFRWQYSNRKWFHEAWEEYRKHVLEAGLGGKIKMPGAIFNKYLDKYELQELEKFYATGPEAAHSEELYEDYLAHYGVKGQKWGIRRYQNEDGTFTEEGKKRYGVDEKTGKMSKEGSGLYKEDTKLHKKELTKNMVNVANSQRETSSKSKQVAATVFTGVKGTSYRTVYDAARASGEGKIKSILRTRFDIRKSDFATLPVTELIYRISDKTGLGRWGTAAAQYLAEMGIDLAITSHEHAKGRAASLQEAALRKKTANKQ